MKRAFLLMGILLLWAWHWPAIAQAQGTFSPTGSLVTARHSHIAVLLPSGKVLVAGGKIGLGSAADPGSAAAELFDPATGTWTATASMTFPRGGHAAVLLPNGKVLVIGGTPANICTGPPVGNSAELFDPATGTWALTGNLNVARNSPAAVLLPDGNVLVAGGGNRCGGIFNSAEIFDPATGIWTPTGSMNVARQAPAAVVLPSGKVLVAGGFGTFPFPSLASAEIFDPTTGTWTLTGSMQNPRIWAYQDLSGDGLILLSDGKVLTAGGHTIFCQVGVCAPSIFLSAAERFNPPTGSWSPAGSMGTPRNSHRTTLLASGRVLVTGGFPPGLNTAEVFDPAAGTFSPTGNMTTDRSLHTATLLADGRVLVAGGAGSMGLLNSAELFTAVISVQIDIKPGSDPNAIDPRSAGVIPVAILTTGTFDARTVSPSTVKFGPAQAGPARPARLEDVDNDGDLDLVLHFRTQETGLACGDTEATLTGETFDGQPLQGSDSIVTVGCL